MGLAAERDEQTILDRVVAMTAQCTGARQVIAVIGDDPGSDPDAPSAVTHLAQLGVSAAAATLLRQPSGRPADLGVLGAVVRQRAAIRTDRLADDPGPAGPLFATHCSFLGVPICSEDQVVGALCLTLPLEVGSLGTAEQGLVESVAAQAGSALERSEPLARTGTWRSSLPWHSGCRTMPSAT